MTSRVIVFAPVNGGIAPAPSAVPWSCQALCKPAKAGNARLRFGRSGEAQSPGVAKLSGAHSTRSACEPGRCAHLQNRAAVAPQSQTSLALFRAGRPCVGFLQSHRLRPRSWRQFATLFQTPVRLLLSRPDRPASRLLVPAGNGYPVGRDREPPLSGIPRWPTRNDPELRGLRLRPDAPRWNPGLPETTAAWFDKRYPRAGVQRDTALLDRPDRAGLASTQSGRLCPTA